MGLFGGIANYFKSSPDGPSWGDRLTMAGAALSDDPRAAFEMRQSVMRGIAERNKAAQQDAAFKQISAMLAPTYAEGSPAPQVSPQGLFGGQAAASQAAPLDSPASAISDATSRMAPPPAPDAPAPYQYQPPVRTSNGLDANSPQLPAVAMMAAKAGIPVTSLLKVLEMQQPKVQYDRGYGYNEKTGSGMGAFHPELDKGQAPIVGPGGQITGTQNVPGAVDAAAQMAGGVANAQETAKAGLDLVDVPMRDGSTVKMPRLMATRILGGTGPTGAGGNDFGVSQTPAAAELAKARAGNQGKNESDVAGARAAMQQVDDQTNMISQNLHDMLGETQDPNTGKWVKTKPSMVTSLSTGSQTDLIEHVPFLNQHAKDLAAKIETVRNGTSFNSLQAIKNAMAAAGDGGTGSIRMTDQTARMLGEINGSLQQNQSGPQFEATLRRHVAQLDALAKSRHDMFESQYQGVRPTTPGQTGPTANYSKPSAPAVNAIPLTDRLAEARRRGLIK